VIAYVDASVILRLVLAQPNALGEWSRVDQGVASAIVLTESLRSLDRLRLRTRLPDAELSARRAKALELIASLHIVEVDSVVLERAAQPMPTELGTLDAIHLATALLWRDMSGKVLTMATHDTALAIAAEAHGLPVVGAA
jgi:predicted nucleic acid-binding protein